MCERCLAGLLEQTISAYAEIRGEKVNGESALHATVLFGALAIVAADAIVKAPSGRQAETLDFVHQCIDAALDVERTGEPREVHATSGAH
ncbi:hypothetical protein C7450_103111 [Chelatococcus asaccharovorans]|uniref:Uncharacterized protein n=1 Tax=Chelatococcus asaccharovorans TaxID=28210 RepID=A0A2V3UAP3_9HYPH|nr:hypothetical protein C7450_103111 [Chelatococcus asaccharovorans]